MEFSAAVRISLARFTSTYCEPLTSTFSGPVIRLRSVRTSQALDDLMRKLLVVHRLLEAEERLAKRERRADRIYGGCGRSSIIG